MKRNYITYIGVVVISLLMLGACTKNFDKINTDPNANTTAPTEPLFAQAVINAHNSSFEAFYDFYRHINPWTELWVTNDGNTPTLTTDAGNGNNRYGMFYGGVGNYLTDLRHIIELKPKEEQAGYVYEKAISWIPEIYFAWYVSDINGDIPYTEAFQARYGGIQNPKFDHQDSLFMIWDQQLKDVISTLKTQQPVPQKFFGNSDLIYQSADQSGIDKWIKAATSLRLKIAMRLMKRDPNRLKAIADEVIASGDLMSSNEESWIFVGGPGFTSHGNWDPTGFQAPKPMVDFMWKNNDPRIGLFFQKNDFSKANFNAGQQQGKISASAQWNPRQYVGMVCSPDAVSTAYGQSLQPHVTIKNASGDDVTLDTVSFVQYRLFRAENADAEGNGGTGFTSFPVLTYADVCFMRAELAARGITAENAEEWYNKGIVASIQTYDHMADLARIFGYAEVKPTDVQIQAYLNSADVKYDPAKALSQIISQEFINYYKQSNEAWALYKRTGMPDANTVLPREEMYASGTLQTIPRRAPFNIPIKGAANYEHIIAAEQHMSSDPDWGQGPSDIQGRVWWDKK